MVLNAFARLKKLAFFVIFKLMHAIDYRVKIEAYVLTWDTIIVVYVQQVILVITKNKNSQFFLNSDMIVAYNIT
jgi:hypothetical protein